MADIYADGTYLAKNATWHEEDSPYKAGLVEKALQRTSTKFETCVDVGCGAGLVAEMVAKKHPDARVFGYDVSPDVRPFWPVKQGVSFRHADLLASSERFDLALCLDVFEHVEDYFGFLRKLRGRAGRFVFNIPLDMNVAKLVTGMHAPRQEYGHLHYYNWYTALATLADTGYKVVDHFFAAGFMASRPKNLKQALITVPRWGLYALGPKLASTLGGGYSLVVTADAL